jgi:hypothetical protein
MSIELLTALGEKLLESLLGVRPGSEHSPDEASAALVVVSGVRAGHARGAAGADEAGGSALSRRVRSDPPAQPDFCEVDSSPAA